MSHPYFIVMFIWNSPSCQQLSSKIAKFVAPFPKSGKTLKKQEKWPDQRVLGKLRKRTNLFENKYLWMKYLNSKEFWPLPYQCLELIKSTQECGANWWSVCGSVSWFRPTSHITSNSYQVSFLFFEHFFSKSNTTVKLKISTDNTKGLRWFAKTLFVKPF